MPIDWAAAYNGGGGGGSSGGSTFGGIDWAGAYGGGSGGDFISAGGGPPPKKSGGGLLSGIENFVERTPGSNIISNLGGGVVRAGENAAVGLYGLGRMGVQDVINHPASLLAGPAAPIFADVISHAEGGHGTHLENQFAVPLAKMYYDKYAPIFEHPLTGKSYRQVEKDPFGTFLDIATLATLPFTAGASAVLKAGSLTLDASRIARLTEIATMATKAERTAALAEDAANLGRPVTAMERAFVVAKASKIPLIREVRTGQAEEDTTTIAYTVPKAKSPWGQWVQQQMLKARESSALRDRPIIGANRVALKQNVAGLHADELRGQFVFQEAQKAFNNLSNEEKQALHVVAEASRVGGNTGEWLADKVASIKRLQEEATAKGDEGAVRDLQKQLENLGGGDGAGQRARFEKIQEAITNPSQKFKLAREQARGASQYIRDTHGGALDEADVLERIHGPAAIVHGGRWGRARWRFVPGEDEHTAEREAAAENVRQTSHARAAAEENFRNTPRPDEFVPTSRAMAVIKRQIDDLRAQREAAGADHPLWAGSPNDLHLKGLEEHYRERTAGARAAWERTQESRSRAYQEAEQAAHDARRAHEAAHERMNNIPNAPRGHMEREDAGVRGGAHSLHDLANAAPDAEHGAAFYFPHRGPQTSAANILSSFRSMMPLGELRPDQGQKLWRAIRQTTGAYTTDPSAWTRAGISATRWRLKHDFQQWLLDHVAIKVDPRGGDLPDGYEWFQPTSEKARRFTRERTALHDELDDAGVRNTTTLEDEVKRMFPKGTPEYRDAEPVYIVPKLYAKAFQQEFTRTNKVFRLMFERPMDLWRAAVLKLRPAWLVNNIVGQHLLYWITSNPDSILPYIRALRLEKSGHYVDNWLGRMMKIPSFRMKYGGLLEDAGHVDVGVGTTAGTLGGINESSFLGQWRARLRETNPKLYGAGSGFGKILSAWPRFTVRANQEVADNWPRYARFQQLARKSDAAQRVLRAQEALGEPMTLLDKAFGGKDYDKKIIDAMSQSEKDEILAKVDRALGNFNTLTPFERKYMRRIFPFYAWFKVIGAVSKDLLIDSPLRVNIVYNLEKLSAQNPDLVPQGLMPTWLQGAIATGPAKNGQQGLVSTVGLNPFATLGSLTRAGRATTAQGGNPSDSTGLLGPAIGAVDLFQGIDPFTGQAYIGPGDKESPLLRAIIGTGATLPETQLLQSYGLAPGGTKPKSYAPEHYGPLNQTALGFLGFPRKQARLGKLHKYAHEGL